MTHRLATLRFRLGAHSQSRPAKTLLIFCFAFCGAISQPAAEERFLRGDANVDGLVDVADPVATLFTLYRGAAPSDCLDAADADDDGRVSAADAVATLEVLFLGRGDLPAPGIGPCPGLDPTPDDLGCARGLAVGRFPPAITFWPELAPPPGAAERQGVRLPETDGVYRVGEGISFALLVEAHADLDDSEDPAGVTFDRPGEPRSGNPSALKVFCDRDLGDPGAGGIAAGENLGPHFLAEIELWVDPSPFLLTRRAALRIDGGSARAPDPGRYRFRASVVNDDCVPSVEVDWELDVVAQASPELHLWLQEDLGDLGVRDAASAATGGLMFRPQGPRYLVVEAQPNGTDTGAASFEVDTSTFSVFAAPSIVDGVDPQTDIADRFDFLGGDSAGAARWSLRLDPATDVSPGTGNTVVRVAVMSRGGARGETVRRIEVDVSYANDVQPIWNRDCGGCHEPPTPSKDLELVDPARPPAQLHRNIVFRFAAEPDLGSTAPFRVWPYYPERSYLFHKLRGTQNAPGVLGSGLRMPVGGPPFLSDADLRLIESWIAQGAPNS